MPSAPYHLSISAARADALFASLLQRSDEPSARQVRQAIATAIAAYGVRGCAARVAQDYGEHPETALTRMRWALTAAASASGGAQAEPAHAPAPGHLHRALHLPCRVSHRLKVSTRRRGPLTVTGHGTGASAPARHTAAGIRHRCLRGSCSPSRQVD